MAAPAGWEPVERVPTYELVLRRIEEQLLNRSLRPGDRLPPERELASILGASRPAVREALRVLQAQGIVRSGVGTGVDSGTIVTSAPSGALTRLLRVHLAVASFPLSDVVESRVMFERFSALGAARAAMWALVFSTPRKMKTTASGMIETIAVRKTLSPTAVMSG